MKAVELAPEARDEVREAATWYDEQRAGLGEEFLEELERLFVRMSQLPRSFPVLMDPSPELGLRRALLPRFPYGVVFTELEDDIRVVAVAHTKRDPGYWLHRVGH
jgi:plasmid stabilization system protein ParE